MDRAHPQPRPGNLRPPRQGQVEGPQRASPGAIGWRLRGPSQAGLAQPCPALQLPLEGIPGKYPGGQAAPCRLASATCCPGHLPLQARAPSALCLSFLASFSPLEGTFFVGLLSTQHTESWVPTCQASLKPWAGPAPGGTVGKAALQECRRTLWPGPESGVSWPLHSTSLFWAPALSGLCEALGPWRGLGTPSLGILGVGTEGGGAPDHQAFSRPHPWGPRRPWSLPGEEQTPFGVFGCPALPDRLLRGGCPPSPPQRRPDRQL